LKDQLFQQNGDGEQKSEIVYKSSRLPTMPVLVIFPSAHQLGDRVRGGANV